MNTFIYWTLGIGAVFVVLGFLAIHFDKGPDDISLAGLPLLVGLGIWCISLGGFLIKLIMEVMKS